MKTRTLVMITTCSGCLLIIQIFFPRASALRNTKNIDEFMIEDQRTHKRQNYVVQRAFEDEMLSNSNNIGPTYITDSFEPEANRDELPGLVVDYANMIRNDIILLDDSVQTRTRKRGNIKKFYQADPPCRCESAKPEPFNLTENFFPRSLYSLKCDESICSAPYRCIPNYYYVTVLKRKDSTKEETLKEMPTELSRRWHACKVNVTIACACVRDYVELNNPTERNDREPWCDY